MGSCVFCRIIAGELPARIVRRTERWLAFHDANPQAPVHVLIVPLHHVGSLDEITPADRDWLAEIWLAVPEVARELGLSDGYRVVVNTGRLALQTVPHLHVHLLSGRSLGWPPG